MNILIKEFIEQATTYIEPTDTSGEGWIFDKVGTLFTTFYNQYLPFLQE